MTPLLETKENPTKFKYPPELIKSALPSGLAKAKATVVQMAWSNGIRTIFRMSCEIV